VQKEIPTDQTQKYGHTSEYREFPIIYRGEPVGTSLAALKVEFILEKSHHHHHELRSI
jgi:hypothetical protein